MSQRHAAWGRLLVRAGGVFILLGALLPWGYFPVGGMRLVLPGSAPDTAFG